MTKTIATALKYLAAVIVLVLVVSYATTDSAKEFAAAYADAWRHVLTPTGVALIGLVLWASFTGGAVALAARHKAAGQH